MRKLSKIEAKIMNKLFASTQAFETYRVHSHYRSNTERSIISLADQGLVRYEKVEDYKIEVAMTYECMEKVANGAFYCDGDDVYVC